MKMRLIVCFALFSLTFNSQLYSQETHEADCYDDVTTIDILSKYSNFTSGIFCGVGPDLGMAFLAENGVESEKLLNTVLSDPGYAEFWRPAWTYYWSMNRDTPEIVIKRVMKFVDAEQPVYSPVIANGVSHSLMVVSYFLYNPKAFNDEELKALMEKDVSEWIIQHRMYDPQFWREKLGVEETFEELQTALTNRKEDGLDETARAVFNGAENCINIIALLYYHTEDEKYLNVLNECMDMEHPQIVSNVKLHRKDSIRNSWAIGELNQMMLENYPVIELQTTGGVFPQ